MDISILEKNGNKKNFGNNEIEIMNNYIKEYWDKQAEREGAKVSWDDNYMVSLEIDNIGRHIRAGDDVLDVGCSNGHATVIQLYNIPNIRIVGLDYSEQMIKQAKQAYQHNNLKFEVGNIKKLPFEDNSFDLVYTTRCLINLPTWKQQLQGIKECIRVTRRKVIFSEGFYEPFIKLNSLRNIAGLKLLEEHDFNRYLKKYRLEQFLNDNNFSWECMDFSSVYYLGSRFLRELVTKIEDYKGYTNPINKIFYDIEKEYSGGGFGIQQMYIITL
jgi:ubiquinone/menaquinone biosynthesis C-methylase UbiE